MTIVPAIKVGGESPASACAGKPLNLFYNPARKVQEEALKLCGACPLQLPCLREELQRPITHQHGVRGGLTAGRRQQLIREWRAAERETESAPASTVTVIDLVLHTAAVSAGTPASLVVAA
jgi:hypothetical protein